MYKHKNTGEGTITISDDAGVQYILHPGETVSLNRIYNDFECYKIYCIDSEQKEIVEEKPKKKAKGELDKFKGILKEED